MKGRGYRAVEGVTTEGGTPVAGFDRLLGAGGESTFLGRAKRSEPRRASGGQSSRRQTTQFPFQLALLLAFPFPASRSSHLDPPHHPLFQPAEPDEETNETGESK